jgi:DNA-directed RNA polymerase specialized sigma24 family protein
MRQQQGIIQRINRAKAGDRTAFDEVVSLCQEKLEAFIRRRIRGELRDLVKVETLASDTFSRAYEALERFQGRDEDDWHGWPARIASNSSLTLSGRHSHQLRRSRLHDEPQNRSEA